MVWYGSVTLSNLYTHLVYSLKGLGVYSTQTHYQINHFLWFTILYPKTKQKTQGHDNYHRISHKLLLIINHNNKDMLAMKTRLCLHWCRQIVVHVLLQLK